MSEDISWRDRVRALTGRVRTWWCGVRHRLSVRRIVLASFALFALITTLVMVEALLRARLVPVEDRVPTGLYTRSVAWDGTPGSATLIGPAMGAPSESRVPVALDEMPAELIDAVLAIEDKRFRDHDGVDLRRIGGALVANVRAGGIAEGGSTITQQLAKNLFLSADRTLLRKARELAMSLVLEARYPKDQILEAYLNEIYLGQDGGNAIHGVGAAAQYYFGRDVNDLSLAECATLAGMIHSPNRLAPTRHPSEARERRDLVLSLMRDQGMIDAAAADDAMDERIHARAHPSESVEARYFRDALGRDVAQHLPKRGAAVYTTLDATLQRAAEHAVSAELRRIDQPGVEAALVAIDPRSGEVLALVGGRDYGASQFNRATDARRQPGSAFKPIVALAALERPGGGNSRPPFTLASHVSDEPLTVPTHDGPWRPANYDGTFEGEITLREALEQSRNVPFARIGMEIGPQRIVDAANRLGITSPLPAVPALALGSGEVSLLELVRAYGVLANAGELAPTRMVLASRIGRQPLMTAETALAQRVADPAAVYLVTSALEGVVDHGTGAALGPYQYSAQLAGKTGTSNDWRDAWFIAYTAHLVVGVWVGHDDGASLHRTGAQAALPVVSRFLSDIDLGDARFPTPEGVVERWVASGSDGWWGVCNRREVFLLGTEPSEENCLPSDQGDWSIDFGEGHEPLRGLGNRLRREAERWLKEQIAERIRGLDRE